MPDTPPQPVVNDAVLARIKRGEEVAELPSEETAERFAVDGVYPLLFVTGGGVLYPEWGLHRP